MKINRCKTLKNIKFEFKNNFVFVHQKMSRAQKFNK